MELIQNGADFRIYLGENVKMCISEFKFIMEAKNGITY